MRLNIIFHPSMYLQFRRQSTLSHKQREASAQMLRQTQWGQVNLDGKWKQRQMVQLSSHIEIWRVHFHLSLNKNFTSTIIQDIYQIKFPQLKVLSLSHNLIATIQKVHRLSIPSLEVLDLSCNVISSVRPMRKGNYCRLRQLLLYDNLLTNTAELQEGCWSSGIKFRINYGEDPKELKDIARTRQITRTK